MTSRPAGRQVAVSLLEQVRDDPHGWPSLDLHKLLDLWEFTAEEIDTGTAWVAVFRYHPEHPDLNVVLTDDPEVHAAVTLRVVGIIDRLIDRRRGG